jgi:hypothetical protein
MSVLAIFRPSLSFLSLKTITPSLARRPVPLKMTLQGESLPTAGGCAIQVVSLRSTDGTFGGNFVTLTRDIDYRRDTMIEEQYFVPFRVDDRFAKKVAPLDEFAPVIDQCDEPWN